MGKGELARWLARLKREVIYNDVYTLVARTEEKARALREARYSTRQDWLKEMQGASYVYCGGGR